jgi:lysophospholipase L1-like esterase
MTHHSDNLHIGPAQTNIGSASVAGGFGFGPIARTYVYDIVPLTLNASGFAASQSPGTAALTLTAGTGVTAVVDALGVTRYTADVPRAVTVTSGGNDTGITFLISGYDFYNVKMTQKLTGASGAAATTTKAFKSVTGIVPSGSISTTVTAGTADVFGLPVAVLDAGYVTHAAWNNALTADAGTFVAGVTTSPATNLTGDTRGTYLPSTGASDGTKRLVLTIALSDVNIGATQTLKGVVGVPQV